MHVMPTYDEGAMPQKRLSHRVSLLHFLGDPCSIGSPGTGWRKGKGKEKSFSQGGSAEGEARAGPRRWQNPSRLLTYWPELSANLKQDLALLLLQCRSQGDKRDRVCGWWTTRQLSMQVEHWCHAPTMGLSKLHGEY